jgi:hypothetical protein
VGVTEALSHHLQPHPFMLLQASDDVEQIRGGRIAFRPEHLMQRLHVNAGLLRQRGKAYRRVDAGYDV